MTEDHRTSTLLITGATGYIGHAFAKQAASTSTLILVDRESASLEKLHTEISGNSEHTHYTIACNLSDESDRKELIETVRKNHPQLNGLINNASFTGDTQLDGWIADFDNQSLEAWRAAIEVNLTAAFDLSKGLSPLLKKSTGGHILNIGSIYAGLGPDMRLYEGTEMGNPAAYAASKGGLVQLTKWLATVLAPNIRVNCISPGGVFRDQPESFVKAYEYRTPLGRMANEQDIVGAMMFFTTGQSQYITGQNLYVDGGYSIW
jgi:NAD(P)-dependent dehydrogenase (short-subunit alcohol dehydrogenase family)